MSRYWTWALLGVAVVAGMLNFPPEFYSVLVVLAGLNAGMNR